MASSARTRSTPDAQILVSNYHFLLEGTRFSEDVADPRDSAGIGDSLDHPGRLQGSYRTVGALSKELPNQRGRRWVNVASSQIVMAVG